MPSRRTPKIAESEWNFRPVPVYQQRDCLIWELARESKTMRSSIKAWKKRGGSFVPNFATTVKFTTERFCSHFKFLLKHFPATPWRKLSVRATGDTLALNLYALLSNSEERQPIIFTQDTMDILDRWRRRINCFAAPV